MTKKEILDKIKVRELVRCNEFRTFMVNENFTETIDKVGSFQTNTPLFYKKVSQNIFLVFNIPYYGRVKDAYFQADFWKVYTTSEKEFLNSELLADNLVKILLGFELEKDLHLYEDEILKY